MKHLDLFSGIGGFALAARNVGWQTVAFCESEPFCQAVLRKHWPDVPIHNDVRELTGDAVGSVDIITGGYPCQPFSLAGKRRGADDDRHLWPEFARLIRAIRPRWVLGENVAGHVSMGLDDVLADMEGMGYAWEAFVIPAAAVGAWHRRDRLWIAAHANEGVIRDDEQREARRRHDVQERRQAESRDYGPPRYVADADEFVRDEGRTDHATQGPRGRDVDRGCERAHVADTTDGDEGLREPVSTRGREHESREGGLTDGCGWPIEPDVGRVAHGISGRVDRLRALGNAIVPQVAEEIFRAIAAVSKPSK